MAFRTLYPREESAAPAVGGCSGIVGLLHFDVFDEAFVALKIVCCAHCLVFEHKTFVGAVEDFAQSVISELTDRCFEVYSVFFADGGNLPENHGVPVFSEWSYSPVVYAERRVGNHFVAVHDVDIAEPAAIRTCTLRRVEREVVWRRFVVAQTCFRVHEALAVVGHGIVVSAVYHQLLVAVPQGTFNAAVEPLGLFVAHGKTVHHDFYAMVLVSVKTQAGGDFHKFAVHTYVDEPFFTQLFEQFFVMTFAVSDHRSEDVYFLSGIAFQNQIHYAFARVAHHILSAQIAACMTCACIKKAQKIIYFRCGAYRASRISVYGFLLYGNDGA